MSIGNPGGPQPSRVYWRRRIVVLLGLLAVIAVVVLIVVRPSAEAVPAASVTPSPTAVAPAPVETAAPPAADGTIPPCAPGQVQVTALTDKGEYAPGELPQLSWTISNVGAAPCSLNAGTSQQVFTITSGSDTIWTSTDCQSNGADAPYTLPPSSSGVEPAQSTPLPWDRVRSSPDSCDTEDRPEAVGGGATYHFDVSVGGFPASDSATFVLN
ncbi:hypothetical protein [Naasia aerilata]|uniref:DUF4232 domain-containing protein n=1 Tax=Naasia aerilata TaxID=1162966 RepID=A0ABM8GAE1_9MICO|nr:hypothetical protein [Naasia aerilata]BDZ45172.1 hypothetical protein GCM10025866_10810 [Naasia aerilata]